MWGNSIMTEYNYRSPLTKELCLLCGENLEITDNDYYCEDCLNNLTMENN